MYVADAEECSVGLLTSATIRAMDCSRSAHSSDDSMSDLEDFEENEGDDDDDDSDDDDSVLQSTQNSNNNDNDSSDDDDQ